MGKPRWYADLPKFVQLSCQLRQLQFRCAKCFEGELGLPDTGRQGQEVPQQQPILGWNCGRVANISDDVGPWWAAVYCSGCQHQCQCGQCWLGGPAVPQPCWQAS